MLNFLKIFNFLKPAYHIERLPHYKVDKIYKKFRHRNFIGIGVGYACYYLLRKNFSLAMPFFLELGFSKAQLGWVLSSLPIAYGISKFIMGNLSDRSNPRYFIVLGLLLSIIANLIFGCSSYVTTSLTFMFAIMFINGWAQGMGAPPCYRTVAHWFSISERGRVMAIWNIAHNVGSGLLGVLAIIMIPLLGWKSIFYVPSIIVLLFAVIILILMRDTPQSVGLMPIEEYCNEYPNNCATNAEKELTAKEILFKYVLVNKNVWFLAIANIFVYFVRYGILDWAPTYLTEMKGLEIAKAGTPFILYELAGIAGMLLCGYISDKLLNGRRAPVSILCMVVVLINVCVYWLTPYIIVNHIALFFIGMFIYGPVMLVGVQVIDLMPKKAVGTTIGLLGLFGYWGGNMAANVGFGYIIEYFGWNGSFIALIVSCLLAILFFSLTLCIKHK